MTESSNDAGNVRVRFAPSPTGYLHVGGARTALFNWLFARQQGGTMVLRIEDTDAERNKSELIEGILSGLNWLGLNWDEGPFYQSQRTDLYRDAAKKCLANGTAFLCYCPPEKYVGGDHAQDGAEGGQVRRVVRCTCRDGIPSTPGTKPAIRFKVPIGGKTTFYDVVFGDTEFSNDDIEDFMLLRSGQGDEEFGQPMYQLSVVVDDIDMRITHVIRGADHLSNTPKQVLLYRALEAKLPIFAHLPLILGPDRKRLSKRHGATSVSMYRDEGFLPEAFQNFLALLGWAPGGDVEFLRTPDLIQKFKLEGVSRTNGVFDKAKLEWFNTQYLQHLPIEDLLPQVEQELKRSGCGKRSGLPDLDANGLVAPSICCVRACGCCLIFLRGRAHFSATTSPSIPRLKQNSGKIQKSPICWRNWPRSWPHYRNGITTHVITHCAGCVKPKVLRPVC